MYHIYEESTGNLISSTSLDNFTPLRDGLAYIELADNVGGVWNTTTLTFGSHPPAITIKKSDFYLRVGLTLLHKIKKAAKTDDLIDTYLEYVRGLEFINLASADFLSGTQYLITQGVLTQEEVDGILIPGQ